MKASELNIIEFFRKPKQLITFAPQRIYRWSQRECEQLWDDILRIAEDDSVSSYFIGTIMYVPYDESMNASVPKYILIDGHQRLATISLLAAALGKNTDGNEKQGDVKYRDINDILLFNTYGEGNLHHKLILAPCDNGTFTRIIENEELPSSDASRLVTNYRYFTEKINEAGVNIELLYKGIGKLTIMDILADRKYINPRTVYERISSTKLDAIQSGLIRKWLSLLHNASLAQESERQ